MKLSLFRDVRIVSGEGLLRLNGKNTQSKKGSG
jgi:hypothetical protein